MALTKEKKTVIVADVTELLNSSKLTVVAKYRGTSVKSLQDLRQQAKESQTRVKVIKNRLVKKAMEESEKLKDLDKDFLTDQLIYAFNDQDELAAAQVLARFAKDQPQLEFVAGLTADGSLISAEEVKTLAALPTKDQLRGQLVGLIASPLSGFSSVLAGNLRAVQAVLERRAEQIT